MTQDDLRVVLLLLGFRTGPQKTYWFFTNLDMAISITCHKPGDVTITDHAVASDEIKHEFRCSPQRAFDYIKEKLT